MIDIKQETADKLKNIASKETIFQLFSIGLVTEHTAKHFLIRNEFESRCPNRGEKTGVKEEIADKFCVSFDLVQKIVAKR